MFNFLKQLMQTTFALILVLGIFFYIWTNYEFLSEKFSNPNENSHAILKEIDTKYPFLNKTEFYQKSEVNLNKMDFNISTINDTILNLNIQNPQKAKLLLFYQSLNDYYFQLKNYEFSKFEDGFKTLRKILKDNQCVLSNLDLTYKIGEKSLKEIIIIEPIYILTKETVLKTLMLNANDFKNYKSDLLLRVIEVYMSGFLNLIYSDNLCKNEEVFKLYKELKDKELKIAPPIENKKDKELSLKDLLFGGKR